MSDQVDYETSTESATWNPVRGTAQDTAWRFAEGLPVRYEEPDPAVHLGKGGIAEVVLSNETRMSRPVALKRLPPERVSPVGEARLRREARVAGLLELLGIIPVHDIDRDDQGRLFYTMKQVVGHSLREVIERLKPWAVGMSPDEIHARIEAHRDFGRIPARLELSLKVCDAISIAHEHHLMVIHRDLKPENIMVGRSGEVLVMDWGLAKVLGDGDLSESLRDESALMERPAHPLELVQIAQTQAGRLLGTPAYAAPEQLPYSLDGVGAQHEDFALGGEARCSASFFPENRKSSKTPGKLQPVHLPTHHESAPLPV